MEGVSLLQTWDCQVVNIAESICSLFHMVYWDFEGRRNVTLLHGLINLYVHFVVYLIQIRILTLLTLSVIYNLHTLSTWFSICLLLFGRLNLNIAVSSGVIQMGGEGVRNSFD